MKYPYDRCDYLLHVLLLKLVKMLAKTPPTGQEGLFQFMYMINIHSNH